MSSSINNTMSLFPKVESRNKHSKNQSLSLSFYADSEHQVKQNLDFINHYENSKLFNIDKFFYLQDSQIEQINHIRKINELSNEEYMTIQSEETVHLQLFKDSPSYLQIYIEERVFPMKIKAKVFFGELYLFYHSNNQQPDEANAQQMFFIEDEKRCVIQKNRYIKKDQKFVYLGLKSTQNSKVELIVRFHLTLNEVQKKKMSVDYEKQIRIAEDIERNRILFKEHSKNQRGEESMSKDYVYLNMNLTRDNVFKFKTQIKISKQTQVKFIREKQDEKQIINRWQKLLKKEANSITYQQKLDQDQLNTVIRPKQKFYFTILQLIQVASKIKKRIIQYKIINYLQKGKLSCSMKFYQIYLKSIEYRSISMNDRNIRYSYNALFSRINIFRSQIKKKAASMISNFIVDNKTFIQFLMIVKKCERVIYLISKVQIIYKSQYRAEIGEANQLMTQIFHILKKEDGFEKADFATIPKYKLSYFICQLTDQMKLEIALEYLNFSKKNFTKHRKRFGMLGEQKRNDVLIIQQENLNILVDNSSIQLLNKLRQDYLKERDYLIKAKFGKKKESSEDVKPFQIKSKKIQYMRELITSKLEKMKIVKKKF